MSATTFVQLSDTHILPTDDARLFGLDPSAGLRAVLARVRELEVAPAFFLVTGDIANGGEAASYERFREHLAEIEGFGVPVLLGLGNHDARVPFRQVVLGQADASDETQPYYYSRIVAGLRILMLDSRIPGEADGALGRDQLDWLEGQLSHPTDAAGDIVVVHHPVLPRGVPRLNDYLLRDRDALGEVLAGRRVLGILSGHSHVNTIGLFAGIFSATATSTAFLLDPSIPEGGRVLDGGGFNLCTVRDGRLLVNPVVVPTHQREMHRYHAAGHAPAAAGAR
jgi:3',5'-cyclic AMP phosphodiesterase CpdA